MPPQIKQDLNRSGWESTDFPSVCENCLPENPYVKMVKEDYGAECKLSCMLDLSFGLPIAVRDAALKMVAPGPQSDINREYFAQNNEKLIEEGKGTEEYEKTDEKARELLRRLAASKPYFRKGRTVDESELVSASNTGDAAVGAGVGGPGPIRTKDSRAARAAGAKIGGGKGRAVFPSTAQLPPSPRDWLPPDDKNIMSLFVTGVEDDLPEFKLRDFFKAHGKIKSLVCSHMSHCAFVNYETREAAEKAAAFCQGRAVIAGCPLRIRWGQPKAIGTMDKEQRSEMLRDARIRQASRARHQGAIEAGQAPSALSTEPVAAPPGGEDAPNYASLAGE
ncbi:Pre-mRNA-splicing factor slt-11 [Beauveria bassiana]|uniref:Pre-mRNA-splicing factor slt-11 n=1 Tax=Beauveria bassiana TaxID=176275 RepID=A0A2N6NXK0_BEABA|nr:Pre-mRNA-splicing factor slt-11 [Beauveria bassiana]